jgi:hypothetical protein
VLASAARKILTTIGDKLAVDTLVREVASLLGKSSKEVIGAVHSFAGFFKHADRDPSAAIEFPEEEVDHVLWIACHDFGRVTGGMQIQAQVYEAWLFAKIVKRTLH